MLISKIASRTKQTKEQVYFKMLQDYGIGETFEISSNVLLDNHFKYYEVLAERNNKKVVRSYVGTSAYNTSQMAQFIDGVVDTAKEMGIETLTPQELARMKEEYE